MSAAQVNSTLAGGRNLNLFMAERRSRFRPCIDLHQGVVKQIVGGSLSDNTPDQLKTNFVSTLTLIAIPSSQMTDRLQVGKAQRTILDFTKNMD